MIEKDQLASAEYIGADISKDKIDVYFSIQATHKTIKNTEEGIRKFIKTLDRTSQPLVVMEYTGGYEKVFCQLLARADIGFHASCPSRVYHFAKQKGYFAKTDSLDAEIIAQFGVQEKLEANTPASRVEIELNELSSRRGQLVDTLVAEKNRLKSHLSKVIRSSIKRTIKQLEREILLIEEKTKARIKKDEKKHEVFKRLQTFKGVGEKVAMGLVPGLNELGRLSRTEIAALVGVAPKNHDSGRKTGKRRIMGGRFTIRKLLYMSALVAIRHNPTMKTCYEKLKQKGKASKVALVAVMRRIIITLNAMLRDEVDYKAPCLS